MYLEASAENNWATQNQEVTVSIEALNRSNANINLVSYKLSTLQNGISKQIEMPQNERLNFEEGMLTLTLSALCPLRMRVSMSAIGSLILIMRSLPTCLN